MSQLRLIFKLFKRDWRSGESQLLLFSLLLAIACLTSVNYFKLSIQESMGLEASHLLGGNMVVVSSTAMPQKWLVKAKNARLNSAKTLSFLTVASHATKLQLLTIKAVGDHYPLLGNFKTSITAYQAGTESSLGPPLGEIWLDSRAVSSLGLSLGDKVTIGHAQMKFTAFLTQDPSQARGLFNFSPKAVMNFGDIAKTRVVQPGSRLTYRWYFTGTKKDIASFRTWLKTKKSASQKILTPDEQQALLHKTYTQINRFLNLAVLLILLLSGLVIALAIKRFLSRHQKHIALMKCYGSVHRQIITLYCGYFILLGTMGITAGFLLGSALYPLLLQLIGSSFTLGKALFSWQPLLFSYLYGFILLTGFALPFLTETKHYNPMVLLRDDIPGHAHNYWAHFTCLGIILVFLLWWQLGDLVFTLSVLWLFMLSLFFLLTATYALIASLQLFRRRVGISWRYGLANLARQPQHAIVLILAFALTLSILLSISLVWRQLYMNWQQQLPIDAPNYFAFNIAPDQVPVLRRYFKQNQIKSENIYPMVRGRLVSLNDEPIMQAVPENTRNNNALHRELNLTWSNQIPPNNTIVEGPWWANTFDGKNIISVERRLAKNLGIKLNDVLGFRVGAEKISAKVVNLRTVDWQQFTPNFYVIFPYNVINHYPTTYVTSFYLKNDQRDKLNAMVKLLPNMTIIDVAAVFSQIRSTIMGLAYLIGYLTLFVLFAGLTVLFASTQATMDRRKQESLLLRILGAQRKQVVLGLLSEFIIIGMLSGLIAAIVANGLSYYLSLQLLNIPFHFNYASFIIALTVAPLVVTFAGWISTRRVGQQALRQSINIAK